MYVSKLTRKWFFSLILKSTFLIGFSMNVLADEIWIDVRSPEEFANGHVEGALLIPHDQIAALASAQIPNKETHVHLYCRSGRRADAARDMLLGMGYSSVTNHGSLENALVLAGANQKDGE